MSPRKVDFFDKCQEAGTEYVHSQEDSEIEMQIWLEKTDLRKECVIQGIKRLEAGACPDPWPTQLKQGTQPDKLAKMMSSWRVRRAACLCLVGMAGGEQRLAGYCSGKLMGYRKLLCISTSH